MLKSKMMKAIDEQKVDLVIGNMLQRRFDEVIINTLS